MKLLFTTFRCLSMASMLLFSPFTHAESNMIILDASGSMWGQVDGKAKITIAREVIADVINDWPAEQNLGLVAYGHRKKGDCADIETVIPMGSVNKVAFLSKFNAIMPKGKTPLTSAVKHAAKALRFEEDKATVVLISDGLESCDRDPCAVAKALEAAGVDFTAHVIGFGITQKQGQEKLGCLANNTGGEYFTADSADELKSALSEVTQKIQAPEEPKPKPFPTVTLSAPESAVEGSTIGVKVSTIIDKNDWIVIFKKGSENDQHGSLNYLYNYDTSNDLLNIRVPKDAGDYEIRYILSNGEKVITSIPFTVTPAEVELSAPESAVEGSTIDVKVSTIIDKNDWIVIFKKGSENDQHGSFNYLYDYDTSNDLLNIRVPKDAGDYEIRYILSNGEKAITSIPFTVTPAEVELSAPESAVEGSTIDVKVSTIIDKNDWVVISKKGSENDRHGSYNYLYGYDTSNDFFNIRVPEDAGDYEIRYILSQGEKVITSIPLTVMPK